MKNTEITQLPWAALKPNPWNRKTFSHEKLIELADSIRANGIIEPLVVRELPPGEGGKLPGVAMEFPTHEILAGERRWKAADLVPLLTLPCIVRVCTDVEARQITAIENLQREDLSALEEAMGYQSLLTELGCSVEDLETRVGKKRSHIYASLRLLKLPKEIQQAVVEGKLEATVAGLLATIPNPKQQKAALKDVQEGGEWVNTKQQPMSFRKAKARIEEKYRCSLKDAPFKLEDASLGAPACSACPLRTGNLPGLPAGTAPNVCTDPTCLKAKKVAWREKRLVVEKEKGHTTVSLADMDRYWKYGALSNGAPWVEAGGHFWLNGKQVPYKTLAAKAKAPEIWSVTPDGEVIKLYRRSDLESVLPKERRAETLRPMSPEEKAKHEWKEQRERAGWSGVATRVIEAFSEASAPAVAVAWALLARWMLTAPEFNDGAIALRRGWPENWTEPKQFSALPLKTAAEWQGLALELTLTDFYGDAGGYDRERLQDLAKLFKVDIEAVRSKAAKEWEAKNPPPAQPAKVADPAPAVPAKAKAKPAKSTKPVTKAKK